MRLSRRSFLAALGAAATPAALGGCAGFSTGSGSASTEGSLTFTTWGTDAELAALRSAITAFEAANDGASVELNAVPYEQMFTNIDAQLQAGNPPDVFRVPYYTFGSYAGRDQLLDLTPHLSDGFADRFTPQAWAAVQNGGSPYGVPHHTDTSVILYDVQALADAGIDAVPQTLEEAWTWEEFADVARRLQESLPSDQSPFAYNWQGNGVTRWLSWLFEADGRFLEEDLVTPAINSDAGAAAVEFTTSFFRDNLVPRNNSISSSTYAADSWFAGTVPMVFAGAFLIPDAEATYEREWAATFPPRNERSAGDFGGNALVATAQTEQPELVARFLEFVTEAEQMREFCAGSSLLPTRADLVEEGIEFEVRPELSQVFLQQSSAVLPQDSGQVASPDMSSIITVLQDGLEASFLGDADVETTLATLSDGIEAATQ
ncbi:sugar ABC transporter substrate-binding protein [uncultured Serinicoccus sp.]|uniref:ABC transporter substrate-binding protein n=1 Tax=uncultured Serinicoccus sp. TaxID=735514 RepID=UPI002603E325|nr:sugar ABC transporter substrate-binding protein [uncultured Serinicoccus sp.]